ncbi:MerR family transcriptional regulator [Paenalkalicoccus suaedae]|uniref:MerR family transcriptional regulator n=1 Tax=Paenalkalicoccus suaedae TaxID=2592382 RepID=A0A859FEP9_9BACI|nr:MerR family transcriptional regulator [Paenalkalicoccus suaedae]QKS71064.1 MerR family transcriptional regulator [Paenalkalicoccus suaedae]
MAEQADGKYNIKAVSTLLGIHPGTLRAWERRYNIIEPVRNDAGHRLYTDEQLRILKWIVHKVDNGFTIGQAVDLLSKQGGASVYEQEHGHQDQMEAVRQQLMTSLLKFEERKSNELLDHAFGMFSIEKVLIDILGSILIEVGDKWEKGDISTAHEHFVTAFLRTRIGMVFNNLPINGFLPKVICVCGPDDMHEIGLLIFTFFLKRRGYETIYLGAGIPKDDVIEVVDEVKPKMVVISCTMPETLHKTMDLVDKLVKKDSVKVGLGGSAFKHLSEIELRKIQDMMIGDSQQDWSNWLKRDLT